MIITPYIISLVNEMISTVFYSIRLIHDDYGGIRATTSQLTMKIGDPIRENIDDPNITIEEYIWLEEEKDRRRGKPFVIPEVSPLNDNKIDSRVSYDKSDDEDYTVVFDKNSFSYKIISANDLKTDLKNDNDKVNIPSFPSPKPTVSYFDDLNFFKDFENEFLAIIYNDALMSKSDLLTEPTVSPQHIDEFDLKDETSLSKCDKEEQNVLYFNDLFPFNVIYLDDSKLDKDNDDDKIDIKKSLGGPVKRKSMDVGEEFTKSRDLEVLES
ncbi:hypothetical protein Tco_0328305 [Tanacetum coccineum]